MWANIVVDSWLVTEPMEECVSNESLELYGLNYTATDLNIEANAISDVHNILYKFSVKLKKYGVSMIFRKAGVQPCFHHT
jgi:hypothetical protein